MSKRLVLRILALILVASSAAAAQLAAQDTPSVAEAARRARQQKQEASKPAKVVTNDSLPTVPQSGPAANPSESTAPGTPGDGSAPSDAGAEPKKAESPEDEEKKQQEIESLRKQIAAKQDEIATEQGRIQLDQTTYFSNPDYARDTAGKAKIDAEKADLDRLQQAMADLKAKLEGLGATVPAKPPTKRESITQNLPPAQ